MLCHSEAGLSARNLLFNGERQIPGAAEDMTPNTSMLCHSEAGLSARNLLFNGERQIPGAAEDMTPNTSKSIAGPLMRRRARRHSFPLTYVASCTEPSLQSSEPLLIFSVPTEKHEHGNFPCAREG